MLCSVLCRDNKFLPLPNCTSPHVHKNWAAPLAVNFRCNWCVHAGPPAETDYSFPGDSDHGEDYACTDVEQCRIILHFFLRFAIWIQHGLKSDHNKTWLRKSKMLVENTLMVLNTKFDGVGIVIEFFYTHCRKALEPERLKVTVERHKTHVSQQFVKHAGRSLLNSPGCPAVYYHPPEDNRRWSSWVYVDNYLISLSQADKGIKSQVCVLFMIRASVSGRAGWLQVCVHSYGG